MFSAGFAWMVGASFRPDSQISDPGIWPSSFTLNGYQGVSGVSFWQFMANSFLVASLRVVSLLPVLGVFIAFQKLLVEGVATTGMKG